MTSEQSENYRAKVIIGAFFGAGICAAIKKKNSKKKEESYVLSEEVNSSGSRLRRIKELQISNNINIVLNCNNEDFVMSSKVDNINISSIRKANDSESKISLKSSLHKIKFKNIEEISEEVNETLKIKKTKKIKEREFNANKIKPSKNLSIREIANFQYKQFLLELEDDYKYKNLTGDNVTNNLLDTHIMFESDGYIEDNEDFPEKLDVLETLSNNIYLRTKNKNPNISLLIENDKIIINNDEELREVLFGTSKYKDFSCSLKLVERTINNNEKVMIINEKEIIVLLNYLYKDLHPGLIELGDNFIEERRKYFKVDSNTYINIINFFLRKKEEFFLCVLSDLMSKLNITQKVLDNTFYYYMNVAINKDLEIQLIKEAYDRVYHAGIKYSIAPNNLTKSKLKKVLEYQCQTYDNLIKEYPKYEPDVIEIIVTDHVYQEFGLDREAIKAAIKKHKVNEDLEFENVVDKLENFQNNSFINI